MRRDGARNHYQTQGEAFRGMREACSVFYTGDLSQDRVGRGAAAFSFAQVQRRTREYRAAIVLIALLVFGRGFGDCARWRVVAVPGKQGNEAGYSEPCVHKHGAPRVTIGRQDANIGVCKPPSNSVLGWP